MYQDHGDAGAGQAPSEQLLAWAERFGLPGVDTFTGTLTSYFAERQREADEEDRRKRTITRARVSEFAPQVRDPLIVVVVAVVVVVVVVVAVVVVVVAGTCAMLVRMSGASEETEGIPFYLLFGTREEICMPSLRRYRDFEAAGRRLDLLGKKIRNS